MKITVKNFDEVRQKVIEVGIQDVRRGPRGELLSFTTRDGQAYEFDPAELDEFQRAGLVRLGRRMTT